MTLKWFRIFLVRRYFFLSFIPGSGSAKRIADPDPNGTLSFLKDGIAALGNL
jgi:hypothetical protein